MPSFNQVKVNHLEVNKSAEAPVDKVTGSVTLDSHDSGKTFRIGSLSAAATVTLPQAEKGRFVSFLVVGPRSVTATLAARTGDLITGNLTVLDGNYTMSYINQSTQVVSNTLSLSVPNVYSLGASSNTQLQILSSAVVGTKVDFICLQSGVWTVVGTGYGQFTTSTTRVSVTTNVFSVV